MAQVDVQSPSQDENFDVVSNSSDDSTTESTENNTPETSSSTSSESDVEQSTSDQSSTETDTEVGSSKPSVEKTNQGPIVDNQVKPAETNAPIADKGDAVRPPSASSAEPKVSKKKRKFPFRLLVEAVLVIAVIALGLWSWTLNSDKHNLNQQIVSLNADPQALVQKQTDATISAVGKLMQLPTGETPTIATVSNASQAKQESSFFANAQNGDKVLLYVKAGIAVLYRPSTNRIILVGPLKLTNTSTSASATK